MDSSLGQSVRDSISDLTKSLPFEIYDEYSTSLETQLVNIKQEIDEMSKKQVIIEKKIDCIINFLDNHQTLMLQKQQDDLSTQKTLLVQILTDVLDKENSARIVVDKINDFLGENRKIYLEFFDSVYNQTKKNTEQIKAIKPLLDNIDRTQQGISSLLKVTYSSKIDTVPDYIFPK